MMLYTVCYDVHCSCIIEANSEEEVEDAAAVYFRNWDEECDGIEITLVRDEEGNELYI